MPLRSAPSIVDSRRYGKSASCEKAFVSQIYFENSTLAEIPKNQRQMRGIGVDFSPAQIQPIEES
jgi:hypothetical protein